MEGSASAPTHPSIELEPPEWQPRALWVGARQLCGAAAFFQLSFAFAYFYLRSQDTNGSWRIGPHVHPSIGLGIAILVALVASALLMRIASRRPEAVVSAGGAALVLCLVAIGLQAFEWTKLGFGPASGGYASVFTGWTIFYSVFALGCAFWIETQVATAWRRARHGVPPTGAETLTDVPTLTAGTEACSFFWTFYVLCGVVLFVVLYLL